MTTVREYAAEVGNAVAHAGAQMALSVAPDWVDAAWAALVGLARSGLEFSSDDLIEECPMPSSPGAVGALFRKASAEGLIEVVGVTTSQRLSRHGGVQRIWRGVPS